MVIAFTVPISLAYAEFVWYDNLDDFRSAVGSESIVISFDDIEAGTNIHDQIFSGIRVIPAGSGAEPIVVIGEDAGVGDRKLFPTSGDKVISPGGKILNSGGSQIQKDWLDLRFDPPVSAISIDILYPRLDGDTNTTIYVQDRNFNDLRPPQNIPIKSTNPVVGGSQFFGVVSTEKNIERFVVEERDNNSDGEDSNIGYDSIRIGVGTPSPPKPDKILQDIVTVNVIDNTLSVLINDGTTLREHVDIPTKDVTVLDIADIDNDNHNDIALINRFDDSASILFGDGTGAFPREITFDIQKRPRWITVDDVNQDNNQDLIITYQFNNIVSILLGDGKGNFGNPTDYTVGNNPFSVVTENINDDSYPDIITTNRNDGTITVLYNDGAGIYNDIDFYFVTPEPLTVAYDDFNGDTIKDIAVTSWRERFLSFLYGNEQGTFDDAVLAIKLDGISHTVVAEDFFNNGHVDAAVSLSNINSVEVAENQRGDITEGPSENHFVGKSPFGIVAIDVNDDGNMDIVATNPDTDNIAVLYGKGNGLFDEKVDFDVGDRPFFVTAGVLAEPPSAVTELAAVPGDAQVVLSWMEPAEENAGPVTDYVIKFKETSAVDYSTYDDGTSDETNAIVTGLTNLVSYDFKVKAVNFKGSGVGATLTSTPNPGDLQSQINLLIQVILELQTQIDNLDDRVVALESNIIFDVDTDNDGLTDASELNIHGTDRLKNDTDSDGLIDGDELNIHGTNPLNNDTDSDGLIDGNEVNIIGTDPLIPNLPGDCSLRGPGVNLSLCDLSGEDLSGVNLSGVYLSGANLSGANLQNANLSGANLQNANFEGANLSGATFGCPSICADFSDADFSGVNLSGAFIRDAHFNRANLSDANLSGVDIQNSQFPGANLSGVNLSGANVLGADFPGANLSGAKLIDTNLRSADLSSTDLSNANLSGANAFGTGFSDSNLSNANLSNVNLFDGNISRANLTDADLSGSNLFSVTFPGADLTRANLSNTDLREADFTDAILADTITTGCIGQPILYLN